MIKKQAELFGRKKKTDYSKDMKNLAKDVQSDVDNIKAQMNKFKQLTKKEDEEELDPVDEILVEEDNTNDIARLISINLKAIHDQGFANVLRGIIFSSDINWDYASKLVSKFMPETLLAEGIELEEPSDEELPEELELLDQFNDEQEDIDFYEENDKEFIDIANDNEEDLQIEEGFTHSYDREDDEEEFTEIASKSVPDSDGFLTDYTMYRNTTTGEYVFIFGDKDIYTPENKDFDWSCDTEKEAWEWYDSYEGISDEDEDEEDLLLDED